PRVWPVRRHAAEGAAGRRDLPGPLPALQLRPGRDRPRARHRRPRAAQPARRPAQGGERSTAPPRPAPDNYPERTVATVPAHEGPAQGRGPGNGQLTSDTAPPREELQCASRRVQYSLIHTASKPTTRRQTMTAPR